MRILLVAFLFFWLVVGCKEKKPPQDKGASKEQPVEKPEKKPKKPLYHKTIENTHNYSIFKQQKHIYLELEVINKDTTGIQIHLQPGNDLEIIKKDNAFLYITADRVYEKPAGSFSSSEVSLYRNLAQAYRLPYDLANFQVSQTDDTLQLNKTTTLKRSYHLSGERDITLFLSPKTDLIKSIAFNDGTNTIYTVFNLYITVQKVPVSMRWTTYENAVMNQQAESLIKVRKISYPKSLAFDFKLHEKAKSIQDD